MLITILALELLNQTARRQKSISISRSSMARSVFSFVLYFSIWLCFGAVWHTLHPNTAPAPPRSCPARHHSYQHTRNSWFDPARAHVALHTTITAFLSLTHGSNWWPHQSSYTLPFPPANWFPLSGLVIVKLVEITWLEWAEDWIYYKDCFLWKQSGQLHTHTNCI